MGHLPGELPGLHLPGVHLPVDTRTTTTTTNTTTSMYPVLGHHCPHIEEESGAEEAWDGGNGGVHGTSRLEDELGRGGGGYDAGEIGGLGAGVHKVDSTS